MPLLSYVLSYFIPFFAERAYLISVGLTFATIFAVGSLRVYVTGKRWWTSGLEMLLVGGATAVVAYLIGYLLKGLASKVLNMALTGNHFDGCEFFSCDFRKSSYFKFQLIVRWPV